MATKATVFAVTSPDGKRSVLTWSRTVGGIRDAHICRSWESSSLTYSCRKHGDFLLGRAAGQHVLGRLGIINTPTRFRASSSSYFFFFFLGGAIDAFLTTQVPNPKNTYTSTRPDASAKIHNVWGCSGPRMSDSFGGRINPRNPTGPRSSPDDHRTDGFNNISTKNTVWWRWNELWVLLGHTLFDDLTRLFPSIENKPQNRKRNTHSAVSDLTRSNTNEL